MEPSAAAPRERPHCFATLTRFRCGHLNPFGIYCPLFGAAMIIYNA
jgi:hypothetical protein